MTSNGQRATNGVGNFVTWDGGCLIIGSGGGIVPVHAHYAIQIAFGAEHGIGFRTSERDTWTEYGGAMIPSRQPHSMDVTRVSCSAVLFVEPETREGRVLAELHLRDGIAAVPDTALAETAPALFSAWRDTLDTQSAHDMQRVRDAAQHVIHTLTGGLQPLAMSDERILRAMTYIRTHLHAPLTLESVAAEACLSPSRFRHLFVEETRMAFRPYILWRRFLRVWELVSAGESLSTAAHEAGFADSAHLARTSRRMFGFPPSAMQVATSIRKSAPTYK